MTGPQPAESAPMTRAMLALAEELEGYTKRRGIPAPGSYDYGVNLAQADAADLIRQRVATALAADPEPREAVIERMARAMYTVGEDPGGFWTVPWERAYGLRDRYRRLAAAALDASRGGTQ